MSSDSSEGRAVEKAFATLSIFPRICDESILNFSCCTFIRPYIVVAILHGKLKRKVQNFTCLSSGRCNETAYGFCDVYEVVCNPLHV